MAEPDAGQTEGVKVGPTEGHLELWASSGPNMDRVGPSKSIKRKGLERRRFGVNPNVHEDMAVVMTGVR